eukprot:1438292-Rhodomonas_salina.3
MEAVDWSAPPSPAAVPRTLLLYPPTISSDAFTMTVRYSSSLLPYALPGTSAAESALSSYAWRLSTGQLPLSSYCILL